MILILSISYDLVTEILLPQIDFERMSHGDWRRDPLAACATTIHTLHTEIDPANGPMIPISYDLYRNDAGKWKVYDISIDGISLITNYRSSFGSKISRSGSLGPLIK